MADVARKVRWIGKLPIDRKKAETTDIDSPALVVRLAKSFEAIEEEWFRKFDEKLPATQYGGLRKYWSVHLLCHVI